MKKNCPVWGGKNHRRFQKKEQRRLCRVFSPMEIERLEYRRKERRRHRIKTVRAKPRQRFVTFEGEYTLQKNILLYNGSIIEALDTLNAGHTKYGKSVEYKKVAQNKGANHDHQYFISR